MHKNLSQEAAEALSKKYHHLLGAPMPLPYSLLQVTSITVEKNIDSKGFSVILSHDIFDNFGIAELTGFMCPQIELFEYLKKTKNQTISENRF